MTLPTNIEDYLDRMLDALRLDGKGSRRVLVEAEDHLRTAVEAKTAAGMSRSDAEHAAIAEFGYPEQVAGRFNEELLLGGAFAPLVQLAMTGMLLVAIIFVSIGISGGIAEAVGDIYGAGYVAQTQTAAEISASRCADYMRLVPNAPDCVSAALEHHFGEIVVYRVATGVLGLLALGFYFLLRRNWPLARSRSILPKGMGEAMGAAAFAVATALLGYLALLNGNFSGHNGPWELLSAFPVAAVFLAGFLAMLVRRLALRDKSLRA